MLNLQALSLLMYFICHFRILNI